MARQVGDIKITGTIEDLCFYRMEGAFFVRRKSTLTDKRFRKDPVFEGSRRSAGQLGQASALASRLYHCLPKERKARDVFRALTGKVKLMIKAGRTEEEIGRWFVQAYLPEVVVIGSQVAAATCKKRSGTVQRQIESDPTLFVVPRVVCNRPGNTRRMRRRLRRLVRERGSPLRVVSDTGDRMPFSFDGLLLQTTAGS